MSTPREVVLNRDCSALMIPFATKVTVPQGETVTIIQALGDTYTVNFRGNLVRIEGQDRDALGEESNVSSSDHSAEKPVLGDGEVDMDIVWESLSTCYDPEIPVNIVDLGLIYRCEAKAHSSGGKIIDVDMTLTAPGCGMGPVLAMDVEKKLMTLDNVMQVTVNLVFDPPWEQSKMTEAAQLQLGLL